jgi:hypothetical protein
MAARKSIRIPLRAQASLGLRFSSAAAYAHLFEHSPPLRLIAHQPISSEYVCSDDRFTTGLRHSGRKNFRRFKCKRPIFTKQFSW